MFVQTRDFTVLHTVTGAHAYRLLEPFIEDRERGLRYLWRALAAAYVTVKAPRLDALPSGAAPTWEDVVKRARESLDEHDLKLVDIAREEEARYGGTLHRFAAARRMRLV